VIGSPTRGRSTGAGLPPQVMVITALAASEDGLGGAVVAVEDDDPGVGIVPLELEDVADVGPAEA